MKSNFKFIIIENGPYPFKNLQKKTKNSYKLLLFFFNFCVQKKCLLKMQSQFKNNNKVDNQQGPTVYHREICSMLCGNLDGGGLKENGYMCICMLCGNLDGGGLKENGHMYICMAVSLCYALKNTKLYQMGLSECPGGTAAQIR